MQDTEPALFALNATRDYGRRVADALHLDLAAIDERDFEDGEHKARPRESVRGRDVYVLQSLYGDHAESVNDKLVRLLFFLATLRDADAARLTAVLPYLGYARKDRRTRPRDPVITRYMAQVLEAVGVDRVVAMDVHNVAAFENAFRIPVEHLEAGPLFAREILQVAGDAELVVVSPDVGGYKRAERVREVLRDGCGRSAGIAFMEKKRHDDELTGEALVGEVDGRTALIVDDLISTGGTLARAAVACRAAGATAIHAAATHGLFTADAARMLSDAPLDGLMIADTVPPFRLAGSELGQRLTLLDTAPLVAEAIGRLR